MKVAGIAFDEVVICRRAGLQIARVETSDARAALDDNVIHGIAGDPGVSRRAVSAARLWPADPQHGTGAAIRRKCTPALYCRRRACPMNMRRPVEARTEHEMWPTSVASRRWATAAAYGAGGRSAFSRRRRHVCASGGAVSRTMSRSMRRAPIWLRWGCRRGGSELRTQGALGAGRDEVDWPQVLL